MNKLKGNKYEQARRKATRFKNNYNMSDKEIIEILEEEIEQGRTEIRRLTEQLESKEENILNNKAIKKVTEINNINSNTILIFSIDGELHLEDGKKIKDSLEKVIGCKCILISNRIKIANIINRKYNYKNKEAENSCPPIEIEIHPSE